MNNSPPSSIASALPPLKSADRQAVVSTGCGNNRQAVKHTRSPLGSANYC